jgi:peptidoglycan/LPS O-acetylase OafA/YrhL
LNTVDEGLTPASSGQVVIRAETVKSGDKHLPTLDALRGIAALMVCWFHFTNAQFTARFGHFQASGKYGFLGVQIFFVISGFIIPFSLYRARYQLKSFFRFMLKRIARLDPPYLASIVIVLLGYRVSSMLPGHAVYHVPWGQVAAHLGYVNAFIGMPWLQMSYWSLAIEFQYYIFVGLCFPLLALKRRFSPALVLGLLGGVSLLAGKSEALLPHYLPLFAIGILAFRYKVRLMRGYDTIAALAVASALAVWVDGWLQAGMAIAACLAILLIHVNNPVLNFFGAISYSLYLMHVFVGDMVFGVALRLAPRVELPPGSLQFIALALAICAAYVLYRLVELPSRSLASRISYGKAR